VSARWDPEQYERFRDYRDRPARDLIARLPADLEPGEVWDLGCGTGEHAALFKRRWPTASVHGLDNSADMLAKGRALPEDVDWVEGDMGTWRPEGAVDLIFTNAALHWLPDHGKLFPALAGDLTNGGVLACQMPMSFEADQHRLLRETANDGPWSGKLRDLDAVKPLGSPRDYYDWLSPLCRDVDVWTTTYLQVLSGENPVYEWMLGTGLRPYVDRLTGSELEAFSDAYRARLSKAFPRRPDGSTLLPFARLFLVARRA
jgi:trans-aconitate 2-methyltransferase